MTMTIKKEALNSVTHSVRASQAALQYGVGAMVNFPDQTLMTAAPQYWEKQIVKIHDQRLEKSLDVDYFGMPGGKDDDCFEGISYVRFPEWYFCPKCRKFQPISKWVDEYRRKATQKRLENDAHMIRNMKCPDCNQELVVSRLVVVCEDGHINDFPWVEWAHRKCFGGGRPVCNHPSMKISQTGTSEGLDGLIVSCVSCGAKASLKGSFEPNIFEQLEDKFNSGEFRCGGRHPWKLKSEHCGKIPKTMQRGASAVYFPVTVSSLVIPPFSDLLNQKIVESKSFENFQITLSNIPQELRANVFEPQKEIWAKTISNEIGVAESVILEVLERTWGDNATENCDVSCLKYREQEYEALTGENGLASGSDGDFVREGMDISLYQDIPFIKSISLIHKVREVQALTGFSRIQPIEWNGKETPKGFVSLKEESSRWYPAYQVRGEGIFIELDSVAIDAWLDNNSFIQKRMSNLNENYKNSYLGSNRNRFISGKFVLLHTLSHLLIKQLSFECGYSIASLKERLYCDDGTSDAKMAGIFIYTAGGDSEGTLGGLVRQGRPDSFGRIFRKAIESASICSNDPVCSLSEGQGRDSLNISACYSCTLIPETSCEEFNIFLDRGMILGTFNNRSAGFYSKYLYGNEVNNTGSSDRFSCANVDIKEVDYVCLQHDSIMTYSGYTLSQLWDMIRVNISSPEKDELILLEKLSELSHDVSLEEDPVSGDILLENTGEIIDVDLIFEKEKVLIFVSDNKENYKKSLTSGWKCIFTGDLSVEPEAIISAICGGVN